MSAQCRKGFALIAAFTVLLLTGIPAAAVSRYNSVTDARLEPVWGTLFKLVIGFQSDGGVITAAQYRSGGKQGVLYRIGRSPDGRAAQFEGYVELPGPDQPVAVRALAAGRWSDWEKVDTADLSAAGPAEACRFRGAERGERDWFLGPVTVDCTALMAAAGASTIRYSSDFAGWQESEGVFGIQEDGVHWLRVEAMTGDGTYGLPITLTVAIDQYPPYLRSDLFPARFASAGPLRLATLIADDLSGFLMAAAQVDDAPDLVPVQIDLRQLSPGEHRADLYAQDRAGNAVLTGRVLIRIRDDGSVEIEANPPSA